MDRANIQKYGWGILSILLVMLNSSLAEQTICVDADAPPGGDGTSWAAAFKYLQDALAVVDANDEIRVAHGTYVPDQNSVNPNGSGDRLATFQLISGVAIYGGYAGSGETDTNVRDIELYETILSGDIEGNDESVSGSEDIANEPTCVENSYHVVTGGDADSTAVLDGFTIIGGNASGSNKYGRGGGMINFSTSIHIGCPTLIDCTFRENSAAQYGGGAAMFNYSSSPTLIRCTFADNSSSEVGGGILNMLSDPTLISCVFRRNRAALYGGGIFNLYWSNPQLINCIFNANTAGLYSVVGAGGAIYNDQSDPVMINCTLIANSAKQDGGGIFDLQSSPRLINCILWNNTDTCGNIESSQIFTGPNSTSVIDNCCIQGWTGDLGGVGNYGEYPFFVNAIGADNLPGTYDDDLRLIGGSPCMDAGDNSAIPVSVTMDADGNPRIVNGAVDMGAYEGANQGLLLSTMSVPVMEGQTAAFTVALGEAPTGSVTVTAVVESGDPDITIIQPNTLTFHPADYFIPQPVTLSAAADGDKLNGRVFILLSAPSIGTARIIADEWDSDAPRVLYVDDDAPGANNGLNWMDALNHLQDALHLAGECPPVEEIRVARGTYKPDQGIWVEPGDNNVAFELINGVIIKGGYAGFGRQNSDNRNVEVYKTILSGDLNGDDVELIQPRDFLYKPGRNDNSLNVVYAGPGINSLAVLDGFVVTAACAGGLKNHYGSPAVANCMFEENSSDTGGGVYNCKSNSTFTNCDFIRNATWWRCGSGMYNVNSNPTLRYCRFLENYTYTDGTYDGDGNGAGLRNWESSPLLMNCVFAGNRADGCGGAIANSGNYVSGPTLINCLLSDNSAEDGGAMYNAGPHTSRSLKLINCTITGNFARDWCGGIYNDFSQYHENSPALTNCILWGNRDGDTDSQGQSEQIEGATPVIDNCCVEGWIGDLGGIGNFDADPYFAAPGLWIEGYWNDNDTPDDDEDDFWVDPSRVGGKYHLKSQAGRWESNSQSWINDDVTSPCIDTGSPITPIGHEPFPNGGIINMGTYGGTEEASKSYFGKPPCEIIIAGDINGDCIINFLDFSLMARHWLEDNNP